MGKVFKNGNSLAVTVPKSYAHQLSIKEGSEVRWEKTKQGLSLITETQIKNPTQIDPEVAKLVKKLSRKYTQVWQDLSRL